MLRRGVHLEYLEDKPEHVAFCWAAYQHGAFGGLDLPDAKRAFGSALIDTLGALGVTEAMLVFAPSEDGEARGVGVWMWVGAGKRIEPHVEWFPWASARNKLEGAVAFLNRAGQNKIALCFTKDDDYRFWHHVRLYGVLRWVGKIPGYFDDGSVANLFVTRGEQWGV